MQGQTVNTRIVLQVTSCMKLHDVLCNMHYTKML